MKLALSGTADSFVARLGRHLPRLANDAGGSTAAHEGQGCERRSKREREGMRPSVHWRHSTARRSATARSRGQALVEFALVFPIFIVLLLGTIEFAFVFNAVLSANYATRDASLVGAEAGSNPGADCVIIAQVLADMKPPVDSSQVTQIIIYRASLGGGPVTGSYTTSGNVWNRGGTTDCSAYGGSAALPYTRATNNYPEGLPNLVTGVGGRCTYLNGCPNNALRTRDTVGVEITYAYSWHTPLRNFVGLVGSGISVVRSNEMRVEPIL
jgi:Flp pilus assembly protein TadG